MSSEEKKNEEGAKAKTTSEKVADFLLEPGKNDEKNSKKYFLIFAVFIFALAVISLFQTPYWTSRVELKAGDKLVEVIADYQNVNGTLPENMEDMDLTGIEVGELVYTKVNENEYELSFVTKAGKTAVYNSNIGDWE